MDALSQTTLLVRVLTFPTALVFSATAEAQLIQACVRPNGEMRVVRGPADCKANETPLSWIQQGPQGL